MQKIMGEVFFYEISLVTQTDNEIIEAIMRVYLQDVPEDWPFTYFDHRFWFQVRLFTNSRSKTTSKDNYFHCFKLYPKYIQKHRVRGYKGSRIRGVEDSRVQRLGASAVAERVKGSSETLNSVIASDHRERGNLAVQCKNGEIASVPNIFGTEAITYFHSSTHVSDTIQSGHLIKRCFKISCEMVYL